MQKSSARFAAAGVGASASFSNAQYILILAGAIVLLLVSSCSSVSPSKKTVSQDRAKLGATAGSLSTQSRIASEDLDTSSASPFQRAVLRKALEYVGTRYCFGGTGPDCFDCSGFVGQMYRNAGATIPRKASEMAESDLFEHITLEQAKPGDLVFFDLAGRGSIDHVGIVLSGFSMIHSSTSRGVVRDDIQKPPFSSGFKGCGTLIAP